MRASAALPPPIQQNNPHTFPLAVLTTNQYAAAGIFSSPMATKSCQAQAPAMPAPAAERGGGNRAPAGALPPPRRGRIKEKIIKDLATTVVNIAAGLVRKDKSGGRVADNAGGK